MEEIKELYATIMCFCINLKPDFETYKHLTRLLENLYFIRKDTIEIEKEMLEQYGDQWINFKNTNYKTMSEYTGCFEYYEGLYNRMGRIYIMSDDELLYFYNINEKIDVVLL